VPNLPVPQRNELQAIAGINERTVRYLEDLSKAIADATMLTGEGVPNNVVAANSSRLYMDLSSGDVWKNTSLESGSKTGWSLL
jgi:hypothetical protein